MMAVHENWCFYEMGKISHRNVIELIVEVVT